MDELDKKSIFMVSHIKEKEKQDEPVEDTNFLWINIYISYKSSVPPYLKTHDGLHILVSVWILLTVRIIVLFR